jgi:hypothetical protein
MLISRQRRFIFIHNQKTAGRSIEHCLKQQIPDLSALLPDAHAAVTDGIERIGRSEWDRYYSFGFVRNPWARLVSWHAMIVERPLAGQGNPWWHYVRERSSTFEEFILHCVDPVAETRGGFTFRRSAMKNQVDYFTDAGGGIAVSFIGRYEALERDFGRVKQVLGIEAGPLPRVNPSAKKDYRGYYSDRTAALVAERFARDIAHFGYTFDDGVVE